MNAAQKEKIRVLIADDHPLFRQGLKNTFLETEDIEVVAEVENGDDLLVQAADVAPNLVIMDIAMPGKGGLEVLKQLKSNHPKLPVLMLSVYPEEQYAIRYLKAGASGYLTKESAPVELVEAVHKIARGGKFASPQITEKLAFHFSDEEKLPHELLSDREYQVFCMIADGLSPTEIGKKLCLSVKNHQHPSDPDS